MALSEDFLAAVTFATGFSSGRGPAPSTELFKMFSSSTMRPTPAD